MKIISKYKDYYDYLVGIYGQDHKIVLDRRDYFTPMFYGHETRVVRLYICGRVVEGLYSKGDFYYGENLKNKYDSEKGYSKFENKYNFLFRGKKSVYVNTDSGFVTLYYEPYLDENNLNIKNNCPILIKEYGRLKKYPKLSELGIQQLYSPEEMYKMINEWLSDRITEKELTSDEVPNNQKIVNKGFDVKRSFRPKMKK